MPEGPPRRRPRCCAQLDVSFSVLCRCCTVKLLLLCVIVGCKLDAKCLTIFLMHTEQYWMLFKMFVDAFSALLMASKGQYVPDTPLGKRLQQLCFECGALRTIFAYAHPSRCLSMMSVRPTMPRPGLSKAGHLATLGWLGLLCTAEPTALASKLLYPVYMFSSLSMMQGARTDPAAE